MFFQKYLFFLLSCTLLLANDITHAATTLTKRDVHDLLHRQYKERQRYDTCLQEAQDSPKEERALAEAQCRQAYALKRLFTPKDLLFLYKEHLLEAEDLYTDKLMAIEGSIDMVGTGDLGLPEIMFHTDDFGYEGVRCRFAKSSAVALASLKKGDTVTLGGICKGLRYDRYVRIVNCEVLIKPTEK